MFLTIDIGTSSCKVAIGDGNVYKKKKMNIETEKNGKKAEQDPEEWWDSLKKLIPSLINEFDSDIKIEGINISSHSPSLLAVDVKGNVLIPCITWQDRRAYKQAEKISKITGENVSSSSFVSKILWIKEKKPEIYKKTKYFLQPKDFIISKLTNEYIIDLATASSMYIYSNKKNKWVNRDLDIDLDKVPKIKNNWDIVGTVKKNISKVLSLKSNIPVIAGGIDAYCETLGAGIINKGQLCDISGTSSCIAVCNDVKIKGAVRHIIPDRYLIILPMSFTGGSLKWFFNNFGLSFSLKKHYYEELDNFLKKTTSGINKVLFLPYLIGARSPIWNDKAKGVFFGLTAQHTKYDLLQSVLEGVAFGIRHNIELIKSRTSINNHVNTTGGASILTPWNQIKSNITGLNYHEIEPHDGALTGGLILAAYGIKNIDINKLVNKFVKRSKNIRPQTKKEYYDEQFERYKAIYKKTKNLMG